ncbi:MAG: hypothetical protein HZC41_26950 [Chloroflexi bacterium]|nr:hypothetical protein [Chloroflexota bacterium]
MFERVVTYLRDKGFVKAGGKQRTDSTHILAAVRVLSTLELLRETLKTTLQALIAPDAPWTVQPLPGVHHRSGVDIHP